MPSAARDRLLSAERFAGAMEAAWWRTGALALASLLALFLCGDRLLLTFLLTGEPDLC
jgi:hypothetical protein